LMQTDEFINLALHTCDTSAIIVVYNINIFNPAVLIVPVNCPRRPPTVRSARTPRFIFGILGK